jgi:hypothetical protein
MSPDLHDVREASRLIAFALARTEPGQARCRFRSRAGRAPAASSPDGGARLARSVRGAAIG